MAESAAQLIHSVLHRNLVFIHGKGGVGKTAVSQAIALGLARKRKEKSLWITFEDPTRSPGELREIEPNLWHLNCSFAPAFEEYAALKIGASRLTKIFLQNKLIRYLAQAAPGVKELVLLGKVWFERTHYTHVIVDMPSTGYGLAMFQSTQNFAKLFQGGPLHRDAESMIETLKDSETTGHVIVALPEEMPLQESLELNEYLSNAFPKNPAAFLVNRTFPVVQTGPVDESSFEGPSPLARSAEEYATQRYLLEKHNLRLWRDAQINFGQLDYIPPPENDSSEWIVEKLGDQLKDRSYL